MPISKQLIRLSFSYYGPTAVWKRNERERHRVRCVNDGYEKLRNHLPVPDKFNFLFLILFDLTFCIFKR